MENLSTFHSILILVSFLLDINTEDYAESIQYVAYMSIIHVY